MIINHAIRFHYQSVADMLRSIAATTSASISMIIQIDQLIVRLLAISVTSTISVQYKHVRFLALVWSEGGRFTIKKCDSENLLSITKTPKNQNQNSIIYNIIVGNQLHNIYPGPAYVCAWV